MINCAAVRVALAIVMVNCPEIVRINCAVQLMLLTCYGHLCYCWSCDIVRTEIVRVNRFVRAEVVRFNCDIVRAEIVKSLILVPITSKLFKT